jgi:NAD(P)-dependent dehydrogenase (short-subunit alcohol dehydrogenase family)
VPTIPPAAAPKTVIVTGAASGIGFACVEGLLADGHNVCGVDLNPVSAATLAAHAVRFCPVQADVVDAAACHKAVAQAIERFGTLDGLIHMAAIHSSLTWRELDAADFNRVLGVNVVGAFLIAQAAAERMARGGAMVLTASNVMSVGGIGGHGRGGPAYAASKGAIVALARALARSLAPLGIRVNVVSPGSTDTAMTADYDDDARRRVGERTLVGRIGRPEEIAAVARFLISDAASYMSGAVVAVNGGGSFD